MNKQNTKNTQKELLRESVGEANNLALRGEGTYQIKREDVKDSPFQIVTTETGSFGVMGKYRITEMMNHRNEVKMELDKITWNRIIQVMILLIKDENMIKRVGEVPVDD